MAQTLKFYSSNRTPLFQLSLESRLCEVYFDMEGDGRANDVIHFMIRENGDVELLTPVDGVGLQTALELTGMDTATPFPLSCIFRLITPCRGQTQEDWRRIRRTLGVTVPDAWDLMEPFIGLAERIGTRDKVFRARGFHGFQRRQRSFQLFCLVRKKGEDDPVDREAGIRRTGEAEYVLLVGRWGLGQEREVRDSDDTTVDVYANLQVYGVLIEEIAGPDIHYSIRPNPTILLHPPYPEIRDRPLQISHPFRLGDEKGGAYKDIGYRLYHYNRNARRGEPSEIDVAPLRQVCIKRRIRIVNDRLRSMGKRPNDFSYETTEESTYKWTTEGGAELRLDVDPENGPRGAEALQPDYLACREEMEPLFRRWADYLTRVDMEESDPLNDLNPDWDDDFHGPIVTEILSSLQRPGSALRRMINL